MSRRENILKRLLVILSGIELFKAVERNLDEFPGEVRPMAIMLDGDEEAPEEFRRSFVKNRAVTIVDMIPIIVVSMGGRPEEIGPDINELLARVQTAILLDDVLKELVTTNGAVWYAAGDSRLNHSLAMDCDMQIRFVVRYPLVPSSP